MSNIAVFPGTFDPITVGHVDIVNRASTMFDEIIIAVGINTKKTTLFDLEVRKQWIQTAFANNPKVRVASYEGLTVDFASQQGLNSYFADSEMAPISTMNHTSPN